jgi:hypothetical protein
VVPATSARRGRRSAALLGATALVSAAAPLAAAVVALTPAPLAAATPTAGHATARHIGAAVSTRARSHSISIGALGVDKYPREAGD